MTEDQNTEIELTPEAIQFLNKLASAFTEKQEESELGFNSKVNESIYVFLNNKGVTGFVWFTRKDDTNYGIDAKQFTGYVKDLIVVDSTRKGKEVPKLRLLMEGDKPTTFEIGYGTNTAKCIISAIASLTPKQVKLPITIQPYQSAEEESVVFVSVRCEGDRVDTRYDSSTDWEAKLAEAKSKIEAA